MNTWTPLWSSIIESSVWREPYHVRLLWLTMLAVKDSDHVVRSDSYKLSIKANLSEGEVLEALEILKAPDRRRISKQEFDGRRIEEVEEGWLILNGDKYRKMMSKLAERNRKSQWAKQDREKKKSKNHGKPLPGETLSERRRREGANEKELNDIGDNAFREEAPAYRVNGVAESWESPSCES